MLAIGMVTQVGDELTRKDANGMEPRSVVFVDPPALSDSDTQAALWVVSRLRQDVQRSSLRSEVPPTAPAIRNPAPQTWTADWYALVQRYGDWDWDRMMRIVQCESHGDENAVSPDGANVGAWQLNNSHGFSYEDATNPVISTDLAHDVWLSQGYSAWSCDGR